MIILLLLLTLAFSTYSLFSHDLLHGAISLSASSVSATLVFYMVHAPDMAITEAAVGAGLSTLIFVWAIRVTERRDET